MAHQLTADDFRKLACETRKYAKAHQNTPGWSVMIQAAALCSIAASLQEIRDVVVDVTEEGRHLYTAKGD